MGRPGIVVVAGGRGRRAGGADKALLVLDGRPLLAHVLDAALGVHGPDAPGAACPVVVVGPVRTGFAGVTWTQESTPGSGPLAGLAAGVAVLPPDADPVLVLGGDMPYVWRGVPALLAAIAAGGAAAVLVDGSGRDQPLASAWRRAALASALVRVGPPDGVPLRGLLEGVLITRVPDTTGATDDVDTLDDLSRLAAKR